MTTAARQASTLLDRPDGRLVRGLAHAVIPGALWWIGAGVAAGRGLRPLLIWCLVTGWVVVVAVALQVIAARCLRVLLYRGGSSS